MTEDQTQQPLLLVDSNVYINLLRANLSPANELGARFEQADLVTCGMIKLEVLRGVRSKKLLSHLESFFAVMQYVPADNTIWDESVVLARRLAGLGHTLPAQDILIAVSAFRAGAAVLTSDRHFSCIPGLPVIPSPW